MHAPLSVISYLSSLLLVMASVFPGSQMRQVKATVFGRKQRALQGALLIGSQIMQRRRRDTLAACLTAWHLQVSEKQCPPS